MGQEPLVTYADKPFDFAELRKFVRNFRELLVPYRPLLRPAMFWVFVVQTLAIIEPAFITWGIDAFVSHGRAVKPWIAYYSGAMLIVILLIGLAVVAKNRAIRKVLFQVEEGVYLDCSRKLLRLPLAFHLRENTGALMGKVLKGVSRLTEMTAIVYWEILPLIFQTVVTVLVVCYLSPYSALVILVAVFCFVYLTVSVKRRFAPLRKQRHEDDAQADELAGQAITNVMTVQSFVQEERELEALAKLRRRIVENSEYEFLEYDYAYMRQNAIVTFGRVLVIAIAAYGVMGETLSVGIFVFSVTLAEKVFASAYRIGTVLDRLQETADKVQIMHDLLHEPETVADPQNPRPCPKLTGLIEFRNVTYRYQSQEDDKREAVINNLSFTVEAGETIGIVGSSGGGKSTLAKLLLRFDDPEAGQILLNGIDIRTLRRADFRRQIGYVPQEVEINDGTILDNIRYGVPDAGHLLVAQAAKLANAHDFIVDKCERGYDTLVGNRGLRLSGGQRQRVGLARALILNPSILLLDEATASVDPESEFKIRQALAGLEGSRTLIVIAHRLSTIKTADRILVIENGAIAEQGTYSQLLKKGGRFAELVMHQMDKESN